MVGLIFGVPVIYNLICWAILVAVWYSSYCSSTYQAICKVIIIRLPCPIDSQQDTLRCYTHLMYLPAFLITSRWTCHFLSPTRNCDLGVFTEAADCHSIGARVTATCKSQQSNNYRVIVRAMALKVWRWGRPKIFLSPPPNISQLVLIRPYNTYQ